MIFSYLLLLQLVNSWVMASRLSCSPNEFLNYYSMDFSCMKIIAHPNYASGNIVILCMTKPTSESFLFIYLFLRWPFCKSPFCGVIITLCFGLQLTLPMGVKARVDHLHSAFVVILRVNSGQGLVPILHLGMVTAQCHFRDCQRQDSKPGLSQINNKCLLNAKKMFHVNFPKTI